MDCRLRGEKFPSGAQAWLSIALFGIINGSMFQVLRQNEAQMGFSA